MNKSMTVITAKMQARSRQVLEELPRELKEAQGELAQLQKSGAAQDKISKVSERIKDLEDLLPIYQQKVQQ